VLIAFIFGNIALALLTFHRTVLKNDIGLREITGARFSLDILFSTGHSLVVISYAAV
jgi:hypothetical protein